MAHVVTDVDTSASPERVIAALTDFSPRRFELWPNVDRSYFKLGPVGEQSAEVTEGSPVFGGVWERGRYDWSRPGTVRIDDTIWRTPTIVIPGSAFPQSGFYVLTFTSVQRGGVVGRKLFSGSTVLIGSGVAGVLQAL